MNTEPSRLTVPECGPVAVNAALVALSFWNTRVSMPPTLPSGVPLRVPASAPPGVTVKVLVLSAPPLRLLTPVKVIAALPVTEPALLPVMAQSVSLAPVTASVLLPLPPVKVMAGALAVPKDAVSTVRLVLPVPEVIWMLLMLLSAPLAST